MFLCVDIGATNTLVGVGNGAFEVVEKRRSADFLRDVPGALDAVLGDAGVDRSRIDRAAVAAAGPVDRATGTFRPPNLDADEVQIRAPLKRITEDVSIINDCNAAVLGEHRYGGEAAENLLYLTISSGIGAGMVIDGSLVEGWRGNIGEVGHMKLRDRGFPCGCGGTDHWEAYCSGNNLPRYAREVHDAHFDDAIQLFDAYRRGDNAARRVVEEMQDLNVRGIANLVNLFNPEVVAMGGGVALNHADIVVDGLDDRIRDEIINDSPTITTASLEEEAVLHGLRAVCNEGATHG